MRGVGENLPGRAQSRLPPPRTGLVHPVTTLVVANLRFPLSPRCLGPRDLRLMGRAVSLILLSGGLSGLDAVLKRLELSFIFLLGGLLRFRVRFGLDRKSTRLNSSH